MYETFLPSIFSPTKFFPSKNNPEVIQAIAFASNPEGKSGLIIIADFIV
jgi:hypothetical protein